MSKQKYAGRHRAPEAPTPDSLARPLTVAPSAVEPVSPGRSAAAPLALTVEDRPRSLEVGRRTVAASPVTGRHRSASTTSVPRLAGTGLLLPTAAAATLVLTATGAHLGSGTGDLARISAVAQAASAATRTSTSSTPPLTEQQESLAAKADVLAAQSRGTQQRAARDQQRTVLTAAAQEAARSRAAEQAKSAEAAKVAEAARAAAAREVARVAALHAWVPYLDSRFTLTSGFGMRWGAMHPGQDFAVPVGTPVLAMSTGTVIFAGWSGGYGNKVEVQYWDGTVSWMAHNSVLKVTEGEKVAPGEVVALSGNTGHSTGPHSHLEIHLGGNETDTGAVPPIPWLNAKGIMPGA